MRYVLRLAETSESSNLRTHLALPVSAGSMPVGVSAEKPSPQRLPHRARWLWRRIVEQPLMRAARGASSSVCRSFGERTSSPHVAGSRACRSRYVLKPPV